MLVTVLLIVYLVFMAPYVVRVKVDQIMQVQSNSLNGSPNNGSIWLLAQVLSGPILVLT